MAVNEQHTDIINLLMKYSERTGIILKMDDQNIHENYLLLKKF